MESNIDISTTIINTINDIFKSLFSSIDSKLYEVLDDLTFIDSNILYDRFFKDIFGTSTTNGILLISNALLIGMLLYFASKFLISNFTDAKIENPKKFIFKLLICGICMNSSYFIIEQIINLNSNISLAIRNLGEELFGKNICFSNLILIINSEVNINNESLNVFTLDGIITGTLTMSLLSLVFSYALRYIVVKVFVLLAPFAFLSLSLESTSWFFKSWIRNIFSMLFIQIIVSIILLILFSMDCSSNEVLTKYIYIGGIYCLIRANSIVKEFVGGISTEVQSNMGGLKILKR